MHLALILLRRHGIAARYVSGYLYAAPAAGGEDSVEVDTHAWLEALLPDGAELTEICAGTQQELARIDHDVADRYFAGAVPAGAH